METSPAQANPGLFSTLLAHEAMPPNGSLFEAASGLRPRLTNPFEAFDIKQEDRIAEELIEAPSRQKFSGSDQNEKQAKAEYQQLAPWHPTGTYLTDPDDDNHTGLNVQSTKPDEVSKSDRSRDDLGRNPPPFASKKFVYAELNSNGSHAKPKPNEKPSHTHPRKDPSASQQRFVRQPEQIVNVHVNGTDREINREMKPDRSFEPKPVQMTGVKPLLKPTEVWQSRFLDSAPMPNSPTEKKTPDHTIEIHIGRIEVRAQIQTTPSRQEKAPVSTAESRSLQAYLNNRSRGTRS